MEKIESVLTLDYKGPRAGFTEAHVLKALFTIALFGKVGRGKLGSLMDLGQGEVRTLIRRLNEAGLISVEERGCVLTVQGRREHEKITKLIPWSSPLPEAKSLGLGDYNWATNVRGKSGKVKRGIEQRDAAIKAGANGALTLIYSAGKFRVPPDEPAAEGKGPWSKIRSIGVSDGDTLIISGANDLLSAEYGALSAALTLL